MSVRALFCFATILSFALPVLGHSTVLIYSNDVLGELEPCGCRSNPLGGVARKANFLKRQPEGERLIQVDAGDLLFPTEVIPEALRKQSELQAQYLLRAMGLTKLDVAVPGEKDFALGTQIFRKLTSKSKVHFLAANLSFKDGKNLKSHIIFSESKPRVAIFGIIGTNIQWPRELKATSPIAAARREVAELRKKADILVAVTHEGFEADQELAKKVPGIDIIIGGHTQSFLQTPVQIGKTKIFQSSFRNQYVGAIPLSIADSKPDLVGLDPGYNSPADQPGPLDDLVAEFKKSVTQLNSEIDAKVIASSTSSREIAKFQTFPACAECHLKQFDFWRNTPHAKALEPLISKNEIRNKECLSCHSLGLTEPGAFGDLSAAMEKEGKTQTVEESAEVLKSFHSANLSSLRDLAHSIKKSWVPVQCENCHLPGQGHPFSGTYSKTVEKSVCLNCHTRERAPEWYIANTGEPNWKLIAEKRRLITCPAGELEQQD